MKIIPKMLVHSSRHITATTDTKTVFDIAVTYKECYPFDVDKLQKLKKEKPHSKNVSEKYKL